MLQSVKFLLSASILTTVSISLAYAAQSCDLKKQELENQLAYAQKYNNTNRIASLQAAIDRVDRNCVNNKTPTQSQQLKIQHKIDRLEQQIQAAEKKGDHKTANQKQVQLNREYVKLKHLQSQN
ncbi:DUF1090 domain-containing protein [Acinetobacter sp. WU_MDCI_Axc73]|nr:DUF1090 domain-containing protein [Acinetobacter sp. WU_MDCI_Axc73]